MKATYENSNIKNYAGKLGVKSTDPRIQKYFDEGMKWGKFISTSRSIAMYAVTAAWAERHNIARPSRIARVASIMFYNMNNPETPIEVKVRPGTKKSEEHFMLSVAYEAIEIISAEGKAGFDPMNFSVRA